MVEARFLISITPQGDGWSIVTTAPADVVLPEPDRRARRTPLPMPLGADGAPSAVSSGLTENELARLLDVCLNGDPRPADVRQLGTYLTDLALGTANRDAIQSLPLDRFVHLTVEVPEDQLELVRLPFEMMFGAVEPFAADKLRDIAITRQVQPKADASPMRPLELPLRVLFVVGRQLDEQVRPGAEYIGLLRRLDVEWEGGGRTRMDLNSRILLEATTEKLADTVAVFRPHAVHFICHGLVGEKGGCLLLTKKDTQGQNVADECSAEDLLRCLRHPDAPHEVPPIVVVNACHSADATDGQSAVVHRSLAAEFAAAGVAVTLGMAGAVADGACRLFTRRFYQSLLGGRNIALASAQGRRASLLHFRDVENHVEWARPTLYFNAARGAALACGKKGSAEANLASVPEKFRSELSIPLCDRLQGVQRWSDFRAGLAAGQIKLVLPLRVTEEETDAKGNRLQFGKTFLLEEIATQAILDRFIPCLLSYSPSGGLDVPKTLLALALDVAQGFRESRERFDLPCQVGLKTLEMARDLLKLSGPAPVDLINDYDRHYHDAHWETQQEKPGSRPLGASEFRKLLVAEFLILREAAAKKYGSAWRAIILIDDLHRLEHLAAALVGAVTDLGLGREVEDGEKIAIPLVYSYSDKDRGSPSTTEKLVAFSNNNKVHAEVLLGRIEGDDEQHFALCQYLLYRKTDPLTFGRAARPNQISKLLERMAKKFGGVPSLLRSDLESEVIEFLKGTDVLVTADEEAILRALP